jgi:anthranilate phosphoribosyltransferase
MIRDAIRKVVDRQDLTESESIAAMQEIMDGDATPSQIAGFITALRMKGEAVDEIAGFASVMREKSIKIPTERSSEEMIDTCGTGGDHLNTFNISTTAAFIMAGAGLAVAKHGNRAMSSKCGSADVLEALGVALTLSPEQVGRCVDEIGIGFMFAPSHHPSMKYAITPRKEIGIRTVFNILGPLTNPAQAKLQLIGVSEPRLTELMAGALKNLGCIRAMVVHGLDGIDELSTLGRTKITELRDGELTTYEISPEDVGFQTASICDLGPGDDPEHSALILREILDGKSGPCRDIVLLNAGAALLVADRVGTIREGIALAGDTIENGRAAKALDKLCRLSRELAQS